MGKSKKDLDRDMMFRKIMPALADNPYSEPVPASVSLTPDVATDPAAPEAEAVHPEDAPAPEVAPVQPAQLLPEPELGDDPLAALRSQLFARAAVAPGMQTKGVATVNLMETMVLRKLDDAVRKFNCCGCDRCRRDVVAYALNRLPPRYVVADVRHMAQMEEYVEDKQIMAAVIKAVLQVRSNPRH